MQKLLTIQSVLLLMAIGGCSASFTDLRPQPSKTSISDTENHDTAATNHDIKTQNDVDFITNDIEVNKDSADGTSDIGAVDSIAPAVTIMATGQLSKVNYTVSGDVFLEKLANGSFRLRFENFSLQTGLPGPGVVLTDKQSLGKLDEQVDQLLKPLVPKDGVFEKSFVVALPKGDTGQRHVVIHCIPAGVEIGRAMLEDK